MTAFARLTAYARQVPRPVWWGLAVVAALALLYRRMLSPALEKKLAPYNDSARAKFRNLLAAFEARGYEVLVTSTVRSYDEQFKLWKNGIGSKPGNSSHETGKAIDLNVRKGGILYTSRTPKAEWEATGLPALARTMGFRWGGDFRTTPYDAVHFDFA